MLPSQASLVQRARGHQYPLLAKLVLVTMIYNACIVCCLGSSSSTTTSTSSTVPALLKGHQPSYPHRATPETRDNTPTNSGTPTMTTDTDSVVHTLSSHPTARTATTGAATATPTASARDVATDSPSPRPTGNPANSPRPIGEIGDSTRNDGLQDWGIITLASTGGVLIIGGVAIVLYMRPRNGQGVDVVGVGYSQGVQASYSTFA